MTLAGSLGSYLVVNLAASVAAGRSRPHLLPYFPLTYAILHVAYGCGYLAGLVHFRATWRSSRLSRSR